MVLTYDATDVTAPWKLYDPFAPAFANDLTQLESGRGYWLNMRENSRLTAGVVQIVLWPGWNLKGWPRLS